MKESRRRWMMTAAGAISLFAAKPVSGSQQTTQGRPRPGSHPNPPRPDPDKASGMDEPVPLDRKAIQQENQQKLRADVARLYEMAGDLKSEMEKTDASTTLSVSLIKKAQEIERLAKQIRNLAKGLS